MDSEAIGEFTEQWCSSVESNPALDVVKRLSESAEELEYQSASCLPALSVSGRKGRGEGGAEGGRGRVWEG